MKITFTKSLAGFLILFTFFFSSCETQEDIIKESGTPIKKETISFNKLYNIIQNSTVNSKSKNLILQKNTSNFNRGAADFIQDIDTTRVEMVQIDGKETFTLRVITQGDTENIFYNMVLHGVDGMFYTNYIKYEGIDNTKEGVEKLINSIKTAVDENGLEISDDNTESTNRDNCFSFAPIWQCSNGNPHSPDDADTPECHADSFFIIGFYEIIVPCSGDSPSNTPNHPSGTEAPNGNTTNNQQNGSNNPGTNPNNTNNTGGVYGNGGLNGTGINTIPVIPKKTPKQIKLEFQLTLNTEQLLWWNMLSNKPIVDKIVNYLTQNQTLAIESDDIDPNLFINETITELTNNTILNTTTLDDQIITNIPPCLESILNSLKTKPHGKFGEIIKTFSGNNPAPLNYNLNIVMGNLNSLANLGSTSPIIVNNSSTITLNQNGLAVATDLMWANTIIHETFHAYLVSIYRTPNQNLEDKDYISLINKYIKQFKGNLASAQHNLFVKSNIINQISLALKEYGVSKGYNLSQQFYDDMAWSGLQGTIAWDNLSFEDQERITSTQNAELYNSNNNPLNTLGLSPKGNQLNCH